jgi:enoyl-CoA hydratase
MEFQDVIYEVDGPVAHVRLNRPRYRNAQSWRLLDQLDAALAQANEDGAIRVIVLSGVGGNFSAGHDLGTPEQVADRTARNAADDGLGFYENFRLYNLDYTLKWRNLPKPTIAMVTGYCIWGGWMIAAAMDVIFAADNAMLLPGMLEYMSVPWDLGIRKAKELVFELRFMTAEEAREQHFVNRVYPEAELERETLAYAQRVAENSPMALRIAKLSMNQAQDAQGFSQNMETAFHDFLAQSRFRSADDVRRQQENRRTAGVELAVRGMRGDRYGLTPAPTAS